MWGYRTPEKSTAQYWNTRLISPAPCADITVFITILLQQHTSMPPFFSSGDAFQLQVSSRDFCKTSCAFSSSLSVLWVWEAATSKPMLVMYLTQPMYSVHVPWRADVWSWDLWYCHELTFSELYSGGNRVVQMFCKLTLRPRKAKGKYNLRLSGEVKMLWL